MSSTTTRRAIAIVFAFFAAATTHDHCKGIYIFVLIAAVAAFLWSADILVLFIAAVVVALRR